MKQQIDLPGSEKSFQVVYNFNHRSMGFQNSITVTAVDRDRALKVAKEKITICYGEKMIKKFTFK
jgi:hypothetical protein